MSDSAMALIEFPADDTERARRFWQSVLGVDLEGRTGAEGEGWQTHVGGAELGLHQRGPGPGDTRALPYFAVPSVTEALQRVAALGGTVVHSGEQFAICKDSEGSPFGLMRAVPSP